MANQWSLTDGFKEGLDQAFTPVERADAAFARGQQIIDNAYKIDENQATKDSRLAVAEQKRREAQAFLDYTTENPEALKEQMGTKIDAANSINQEIIAGNEGKATARDERTTIQDLIDTSGTVVTPATKDDQGNVLQDETRRDATDIERLEIAAARAPTYAIKQTLDTQVKVKYGLEAQQAIAGGDLVGGYQMMKKAGIISGNATLEADTATGGYRLKGTYIDRPLSEAAVREMFFSQATKEALATQREKFANTMQLANFNAEKAYQLNDMTTDRAFKLNDLTTRRAVQIANINGQTRRDTSKYGRGGGGESSNGGGGDGALGISLNSAGKYTINQPASNAQKVAPVWGQVIQAWGSNEDTKQVATNLFKSMSSDPVNKQMLQKAMYEQTPEANNIRIQMAEQIQSGTNTLIKQRGAMQPQANMGVPSPAIAPVVQSMPAQSLDEAQANYDAANSQFNLATSTSARGQFTDAQIITLNNRVKTASNELKTIKAAAYKARAEQAYNPNMGPYLSKNIRPNTQQFEDIKRSLQ